MAKHTPYDAQKYLIYFISLFGFNESNVILRVYNLIVRVLVFLILLYIALNLIILHFFIKKTGIQLLGKELRNIILFTTLYYCANIFCFWLCHIRKVNFSDLLKVLKCYGVSQKPSRKQRKWKLLAFIILSVYFVWQCLPKNSEKNLLQHALALIFTLLRHCLPLCSLLVLFSVHYVNQALNEKIKEIKKCKSPLRRARLTTRLILFSTRLNPLVKATNDYGAPLMFMLKSTATILIVIIINIMLVNYAKYGLGQRMAKIMANVPPFLFFLIYFWYLRVAPSANQIPSVMARVMLENVMSDEQGMSREPISRVQLLRARLDHLVHLTHSNIDQEQFTVLGEPVDEADIFMIIVEFIDNFNTYNLVI